MQSSFKIAALLALAALAAPHASHAQSLTLNSGDIVTVNGTGTVNANPTGTPVNSTAISYSDSNSFYAVQTSGTAAFILGSGGSLTATSQYACGLVAAGSGPITINGGSLTATGQFGYGMNAAGPGIVTITGGTFTATGNGGYGLDAAGRSAVTITGGTFTGGLGSFGLYTTSSSTVDLYGSFNGLIPGQTQTLPSFTTGSIVGTLANNTASQIITYYNNSTIRLHDVAPTPEPSQTAALAFGALGLSALALRARRRRA